MIRKKKYISANKILVIIIILLGIFLILDVLVNNFGKQLSLLSSNKTQNLIIEPNYQISYSNALNANLVFSEIHQSLLNSGGKDLENVPVPDHSKYIRWVGSDGWILEVPSNLIFEVYLHDEKQSQYYSEKINSLIANVLEKNGYSNDPVNSSNSWSDERFYDYLQAFKSQSSRCLSNTLKDSNVIRFGCFDFQAYNSLFKRTLPFLIAMNNKKAGIYELNIHDNKAVAKFSFEREGGIAQFYQDSMGWHLISSGNGFPECEELIKNNVPSHFWVSCMGKNNQLQKNDTGFYDANGNF